MTEKKMAKDEKTTTAVAETPSAAVPAGFDYGDHAGEGFEGITGKDLSVPFLGILQANSPQVENESPLGSKSGMLYNTVTRELVMGDVGVPFLPCYKEGPIWVEWVPRNKGGGFVGLHEPESDAVKNGVPIKNDQGKETRKLRYGENELVETFYMYGLTLDTDGVTTVGFAVISFTSTKIKPYRDFITATYTLRGKPPIFANRAVFRTTKQIIDGQSFYNFQIDPFRETWTKSLIDPVAEKALMEEAVAFREMVVTGMARAAFETQDATGDATPPTGGGDDDEKAPF